MTKNVKKIIICVLIASTFSTLQIGNGFIQTKAYASSSKFNLKNIYLSDGKINFSPDVRNYNIKVDGDVDKIRISAKPDSTSSHYDEYTVDIDGTIVDEEDDFRAEVDLYKGKNEIKVRIENEDGKKKVYTLNITRGKLDSESYDDNIYLKDIYLDYGDIYIDFDKDVTSYNIEVEEYMDQIAINGIPEDSDDTVRINGSIVKEDKDEDKKNSTKNYKKIVKLDKGKNVVEIEISNYESEKKYKVNIIRGNQQASQNNDSDEKKIDNEPTQIQNNSTDTTKYNKWIEENGVWKYSDIKGYFIKNTWFFDENYGKSYYLNSDGSMAVGWLLNNQNWYYLDESGAKQIGWKLIEGKWYYFNELGIMEKSKTIGKYKLGADGVWIKS